VASKVITTALSGQAVKTSKQEMPWDADYLYFSVREPWPNKSSATEITFGKATRAETMATITLADKQGHLVVKY